MGPSFAATGPVLSDLRRLIVVSAAGAALAGLIGAPLVLQLVAFAVPMPPANLTATVLGSTVTLAWQSGGGAAGTYWLEAGSGAGLANLGRWPSVAPSMVAMGVPDGRYFVRVRASNADGASGPSNEVVVRVGCVEPAVPTGLAASVSGTHVSLSWAPVPEASAYVLEAGSAPGLADVAVIPTVRPGLAGAAPPGTYFVRVRAVSPCGTSAPSGEIVAVLGGGGTSTLPVYGMVDPITAFDPANPNRLLYMWDPAMQVINVHRDDWSTVRGCDREAYHVQGLLYNGSYLDTGRTTFYTDAMGQEVAATDPRALTQHVSRHYGLNPASSDDGNEAFKKHRSHCGLRGALGLKN
jgi:hypothetical protein